MAEAAGLILGVLPLVVEVAKNYKKVHQLYDRYKNCGPEFAEFQRRLQVEQTSFYNEVQILLASLTNLDTASKLIDQDSHPLLSDPEIVDKFSQHLGNSEQICVDTVEAVRGKLSAMKTYIEARTPVSRI